jgi:hypothetical protein
MSFIGNPSWTQIIIPVGPSAIGWGLVGWTPNPPTPSINIGPINLGPISIAPSPTTTTNTPGSSTIERIAFNSDTRTQIAATLSGNRSDLGSFFSGSAGYICGGTISQSFQSTVDKLTFATETRTNVTVLPAASQEVTGIQSSTNGYAVGGSPAIYARYAFATDARTTLSWAISAFDACGFSSSNNGYLLGGRELRTTVTKVLFSNDSTHTLITALGAGAHEQIPFSSRTQGYACGGHTSAGVVSTLVKYSYATDVRSTSNAQLSGSRNEGAGVYRL